MNRLRLVRFGALAITAAASSAFGRGLRAQSPQGARETVQLAFGYECEDRFMIRNDGAQGVDLEYGIQGARDHSKLHLNARESVEVSSASNTPVELWVGGKVVATERKGNRACAAGQGSQAGPEVVVRPLNADTGYVAGGYGSSAPYTTAPVVVVAPQPYYYPPYYYSPYYYGWGPAFSFVVPFRGGFGGGVRVIGRGGFGRGGFGRVGHGRH
jgi:hypothetical protein